MSEPTVPVDERTDTEREADEAVATEKAGTPTELMPGTSLGLAEAAAEKDVSSC